MEPAMTVRELIERLATLPPDMPVAAVAASRQGPDVISDFASIGIDEPDQVVYLHAPGFDGIDAEGRETA
jgi:hypothetical protein